MVEEKIITILGVEYIVSSDGHIYSTHNSTVFNIVNYKTWKYFNSSATTIESVV